MPSPEGLFSNDLKDFPDCRIPEILQGYLHDREFPGGFCFFLYVNVRFVLIPVLPGWDTGKPGRTKK